MVEEAAGCGAASSKGEGHAREVLKGGVRSGGGCLANVGEGAVDDRAAQGARGEQGGDSGCQGEQRLEGQRLQPPLRAQLPQRSLNGGGSQVLVALSKAHDRFKQSSVAGALLCGTLLMVGTQFVAMMLDWHVGGSRDIVRGKGVIWVAGLAEGTASNA